MKKLFTIMAKITCICNGLLRGNSPFNAPARSLIRYDFEFVAPVSHGLCNPIQCYEYCAAAVNRLLGACFPSTIFRAVGSVVIHTAQRVGRCWGFPHIIGKIIKRGCPRLTYCDSAPTIIFVIRMIFSGTSRPHPSPASVFFSSIFTAISVLVAKGFRIAAARDRGAVSYVVCSNFFNCTAFTFALPNGMIPMRGGVDFKNGQLSKFFTNVGRGFCLHLISPTNTKGKILPILPMNDNYLRH